MEKPVDGQKQINIEIPEDKADGIYSNLAVITHSHAEFIVDFIRVMPGVPNAKVQSRIILTPQHAKRLLKAIKDNIAKYEKMYGEIEGSDGFEGIPMNFGGPVPEA